MISTKLYIPNKRGERLAAVIDEATGSEPRAFALFAHCFTCSKDLKSITNINQALANHDIATLRFDMIGIGESDGDFSKTNFTTQMQDFHAAADFLKSNYEAPALAIGHSLGGAVAILSSIKISSVKAVVAIAAPSEPAKLSLKLRRTKDQCIREGTAERDIGGVKLKFRPEFFADIEKYQMLREIKNLRKPLLIMHSPADTYGDFSNAEEIYKAALQPKSLVSLDDIDHLMLKKSDALWVGEIIADWVERYLP